MVLGSDLECSYLRSCAPSAAIERDGIWVPRENAEEAASPLAVKEQLVGGEHVDTGVTFKISREGLQLNRDD